MAFSLPDNGRHVNPLWALNRTMFITKTAQEEVRKNPQFLLRENPYMWKTTSPDSRGVNGYIRFIGVCIPWRSAHVSTGRGNAVPWGEHGVYTSGSCTQPRLSPLTCHNRHARRSVEVERVFE
jgi:hypothetical protein